MAHLVTGRLIPWPRPPLSRNRSSKITPHKSPVFFNITKNPPQTSPVFFNSMFLFFLGGPLAGLGDCFVCMAYGSFLGHLPFPTSQWLSQVMLYYIQRPQFAALHGVKKEFSV